MKANLIFIFSFLTSMLLINSQANAIIEFRLNYGALASKPELSKLYTGGSTLPTVAPTYGLGADLLLSFPLVPIGIGARMENMNLSASLGGLEFTAKNQRTAVLLNYRLIDTLVYVGPMLTYGVNHTSEFKVSQNGTTLSKFTSDKVSTYSVGLEAGVKLIGLSLGAEAGTETMIMKGSKDAVGTIGGTQDINMSGSYFKLLLGLGI
jgi:hypothetical protein